MKENTKNNYKVTVEDIEKYYDIISRKDINNEDETKDLINETYDEIFKILFFNKEDIYKIMSQFDENEDINVFYDLFTLATQFSLDNNYKIQMMKNYSIYYAKYLDFIGVKTGMIYHCVGLFFLRLNQLNLAEKYFTIAYIGDLKTMGKEEAYNSNASCALRTDLGISNLDYIFTTIPNIINDNIKDLSNLSTYEFLEILK